MADALNVSPDFLSDCTKELQHEQPGDGTAGETLWEPAEESDKQSKKSSKAKGKGKKQKGKLATKGNPVPRFRASSKRSVAGLSSDNAPEALGTEMPTTPPSGPTDTIDVPREVQQTNKIVKLEFDSHVSNEAERQAGETAVDESETITGAGTADAERTSGSIGHEADGNGGAADSTAESTTKINDHANDADDCSDGTEPGEPSEGDVGGNVDESARKGSIDDDDTGEKDAARQVGGHAAEDQRPVAVPQGDEKEKAQGGIAAEDQRPVAAPQGDEKEKAQGGTAAADESPAASPQSDEKEEAHGEIAAGAEGTGDDAEALRGIAAAAPSAQVNELVPDDLEAFPTADLKLVAAAEIQHASDDAALVQQHATEVDAADHFVIGNKALAPTAQTRIISCRKCGEPTDDPANDYRCKPCNVVSVKMTRALASWPTTEFKGLSDEEQTSFWLACKGKDTKFCIDQIANSIAASRTEYNKEKSTGEFLPLSVWQSRGWDPAEIEATADATDIQYVGNQLRYRVHIRSSEEGKTEQKVRSQILNLVEKQKNKSKMQAKALQDKVGGAEDGEDDNGEAGAGGGGKKARDRGKKRKKAASSSSSSSDSSSSSSSSQSKGKKKREKV